MYNITNLTKQNVNKWMLIALICYGLLLYKLSGMIPVGIPWQVKEVNDEELALISDVFEFPEVNQTEVFGVSNTSFDFENDNPPRWENRTDESLKNLPESELFAFFKPGLSYKERQFTLALFQTFIRACAKFELSFFLYGGSLLGAARHHDIIPWDDDIDVTLNAVSKDRLKEALSSMGDQFGVYAPKNYWWKFYWTKSEALATKNFRWPYIDIFFYEENNTHIYNEHPSYKRAFAFPKSHVFPLTLRPFSGALLPVPCQTDLVVQHNYSPGLCKSALYNHKYEVWVKPVVTTPCKRLYSLYPFVFKQQNSKRVFERLMVKNRLVSSFATTTNCS